LLGYRGEKPPTSLSVATLPAVLQELRRDHRPILLDHLLHRRQELPTVLDDAILQREVERTTEAIADMRTLHASVLIPMLYDDRVLGILTLGTEPMTDAFTTENISNLLSVAEACAVIIENSHEYEKLRERDRMAVVGEMATGMAHEIRNPLGAIKGAAQCIDPTYFSEEAKDLFAVIIEEVNRLNGVVSQFLEYARPYRGDAVLTDINQVIKGTLNLLELSIPETIRIDTELEASLPLVLIDPEQLKQVCINLLINSKEAMPEGGTLKIETGVQGDTICAKFQDSGIGIEAHDMQNIFMPFFTTKTKGTGLGLAISQRIMQSAGGSIEVASNTQGTTFTLKFCLATKDIAA
jgi:signal transduction histidine kinase